MRALVRRATPQEFPRFDTYLMPLDPKGEVIEYGYRPAARVFESFVEAATWVDTFSTEELKFEIVSA